MILFRKSKYKSGGSLSKLAFKRFLKDKIAIIASSVIIIAAILSFLGYAITPDKTPFANKQNLLIATKKPGFKTDILKITLNQPESKVGFFKLMFFGRKSNFNEVPIKSYRIENDYIYYIENVKAIDNTQLEKKIHILDVVERINSQSKIKFNNGFYIYTDIYGKQKNISKAECIKTLEENHIINHKFILGTDRFGRDLLSQLIIGARVSLSVGFVAISISLLIGIVLGAIAGYFGGMIDNIILWLINVVWSIPGLLLVIAITMALGKGFWQVFIAIGLTMWVEVARVVRGQVMSIKKQEFVEAGKALGYTDSRIIFRHIIPNVLSPLIVISAANFASAILLEAGLSFLGIGVQPPMPSWGMMIKEHYGYIIIDYAYLALIPGFAIMIMVLAFI